MTEKYISWTRAVTERICLKCGKKVNSKPPDYDGFGSPYCAGCQKKVRVKPENETPSVTK